MIKLENLTYLYSQNTPFEKAAINDINLTIGEGEFVGLIGHTGSGKSTLVQHLNGLFRPTSGRVLIDGEDIWAKPKEIRKFRFKVGLVFQYPEHQLFEETVFQDIAFGPKNMGLPKEEVEIRVLQASKMVGLTTDLLNKSPFELSGGQKRRVAIAGVVAMEPEVLILDEPTAGLDPAGRQQILQLISDYHFSMNNTVLLVSHSMEDIAAYAEKVIVMNESRVAMYDDVGTIFSRAEELESMGLDVPEITKISMALNKQGYDIKPNTYTIESAKEQILQLLKKGGGK